MALLATPPLPRIPPAGSLHLLNSFQVNVQAILNFPPTFDFINSYRKLKSTLASDTGRCGSDKSFCTGAKQWSGWLRVHGEITRCVCTLVTTIKSGEYCHTQVAVLQQAMTHWFCCIAWCCLLHYTCCRTCNTVKED